jgi:hypothetical protein
LLLAQVPKYPPAGADQGVDCHRIAVVEEEFNGSHDLPPRSVDLVYPKLGHATIELIREGTTVYSSLRRLGKEDG